MNPSFQGNPPVVKFVPEGGIRGYEKPALFLFLNVIAWKQILEMTCNDFQTELTSHTKANNLFETVSLVVDRLSRPCPF
ncbi:hypothetical protein SPSYN_03152 [Sporotomaculum syntrophicum]|uniref:Uncharacterized protein n=1 Tax=Sporotomaculum syntrophicum TaxID=182264 RepID=A0A9D3AV66_9FIRM|nr:hypothetical protein SPSYN_03152 [Sporotomaculum syntrophicum]